MKPAHQGWTEEYLTDEVSGRQRVETQPARESGPLRSPSHILCTDGVVPGRLPPALSLASTDFIDRLSVTPVFELTIFSFDNVDPSCWQ